MLESIIANNLEGRSIEEKISVLQEIINGTRPGDERIKQTFQCFLDEFSKGDSEAGSILIDRLEGYWAEFNNQIRFTKGG